MSDGFQVVCADCQQKVVHRCHTEIEEAVVSLLTWVPETGLATSGLKRAFFKAAKEHGWNAEPDSLTHPIFGSQSWSYPLLGSKDTARSFHAVIHNVVRALGFDPHAIMERYYAERAAHEKLHAEREALRKKRRAERARAVRYMKGNAPMAKREARLEAIVRDYMLGNTYKTLDELQAHYDHVPDYLKNYYNGGIQHKVNKRVIENLRAEAAAAWPAQQRKPESEATSSSVTKLKATYTLKAGK